MVDDGPGCSWCTSTAQHSVVQSVSDVEVLRKFIVF